MRTMVFREEDLAVKTFVAGTPDAIDLIVNEFRKQYVVRFIQSVPRSDGKYERLVFYVEPTTTKTVVQSSITPIQDSVSGKDKKLQRLEELKGLAKTKYQRDFVESMMDSLRQNVRPSTAQLAHYTRVLNELGEDATIFF